MKKKILSLFVAVCLINPLAYPQRGGARVRVAVEDTKLYTIIASRKYFIDELQRKGAVIIPDPMIDPTNTYIFYASNTGCGFEGEGMTVFISDIYGKKKFPILGRCWHLKPIQFLKFEGAYYLIITQASETDEMSFWLYDINGRKFVLHADGEIKQQKNGVFSYGHYEAGKFKQTAIVTTQNLVKRERPLKSLPRYPIYGLTQKADIRVYITDNIECHVDENHYKTIRRRGAKVLILYRCRDGGYEIYYEGMKGKVSKDDIKPIERAGK